MILFLDANILVDIVLKRISTNGKKFWATSSLLLNDIINGRHEGYISGLTLYITYVLLNPKKRKNDDIRARKVIKKFTSILNVVSLSKDIIQKGVNEKRLLFEDVIQFVSALDAKADAIVIRNLRDFMKVSDDIKILTPEEVLGIT